MKKILFLFFISITLLGYAQKFQLTDPTGNSYTHGQTIDVFITDADLNYLEEYVEKILVVNLLTSNDLTVRAVRTDNLAAGMEVYSCFGGCPIDNNDITFPIPKDTCESYDLHLLPNGNVGLCEFQIDFMAEDESMTLYVNIEVHRVGVQEHKNANVSLTAYPNPASVNSFINISYTLTDKSNNNRLVIRNILGSSVMNIPLNPYENFVSIDTSPLVAGVYFYAIENKTQISIAKKLIVK